MLGPMLFLSYVNNLPDPVLTSHVAMLAYKYQAFWSGGTGGGGEGGGGWRKGKTRSRYKR